MSNNECSKYKILSTHYKCIICELVLIYTNYYDKRGIDNLNNMVCKLYQARDASIELVQLSESITLVVNSESTQVEVAQDNNNLNLNKVAQLNMVN